MPRKFVIDVLMEAKDGSLVFRPIRASKDDLRELIKASGNSVVRYNAEKRAKEKRVRV